MTTKPVELSPQTTPRLELLFPPMTREEARRLSGEINPESLERVRFAALKVSDGKIEKLKMVIELAKADWRDLLVSASFAQDSEAHKTWLV